MARFDANPDLDTTFHFDTDPDPDPTHSCWKKRNLFLTFFFTAKPVYIIFFVSLVGVLFWTIFFWKKSIV
jgi:hypothetical protein